MEGWFCGGLYFSFPGVDSGLLFEGDISTLGKKVILLLVPIRPNRVMKANLLHFVNAIIDYG